MIIIPAIDLKNGKVVRLLRGEYDKETVYGDDPLSVARQWKDAGAELIHIVNLDGALSGDLKQLQIVKGIIDELQVNVEFGGGIRSIEDIKAVFASGVKRVIIGTKAFTDPGFLSKIADDSELKGNLANIIIGVDCKWSAMGNSYMVATTGWTGETCITHQNALDKMSALGFSMTVLTDISRDGTLAGPNINFLELALSKNPKIQIIASGGIANIEDIKTIMKLKKDKGYNNLYGVITGKALYEGKINLKEAIEQCR